MSRYLVTMESPDDHDRPCRRHARETYENRLSSTHWNRAQPDRYFTGHDVHEETNAFFATFLLGIQKLEDEGKLLLAHQALFEDMLECWTALDSMYITYPISRFFLFSEIPD